MKKYYITLGAGYDNPLTGALRMDSTIEDATRRASLLVSDDGQPRYVVEVRRKLTLAQPKPPVLVEEVQ